MAEVFGAGHVEILQLPSSGSFRMTSLFLSWKREKSE